MYASDLMGKKSLFFYNAKKIGMSTLRINNWEKFNSLSFIAHGLSKKMRKA